jgi:hypothetical protein
VNFKLISALAAGLLMSAPTFAANVTLDFEGIVSTHSIGDYYNGGAGGNYGITFGGDALAWDNVPLPEALPLFDRAENGASVMTPVTGEGLASMNVANGFAGTLSFDYSSVMDTSVRLYSGLDGTGDLISTIDLTANATNCTTSVMCMWQLVTLDFGGVARSVTFGDAADVAAFDNVSVSAVPLPAAGWLLMSALGGVGAWSRRKRAAAAA